MNNKGQALVEFILILPVFIFILFIVVDFGIILNTKNSLENSSTDIVTMVKNNKSQEEISNMYKDIKISVIEDNNYIKINLVKEVDIITPGLNKIIDDPYIAKVERVIYNEKTK